MTLIATNPSLPTSQTPNFAEVFRAFLLSEAKNRIEEVCNEVLAALNASLTATAPVVDTQATEPRNASEAHSEPSTAKVSEPIMILPTRGKRGGATPSTIAGAKRNALHNVVPRMMMLDSDFGGNLAADEVCHRFKFSRKRYHEYKKVALAIWRCHKAFGGQMDYLQTAKAAQISHNTLYRYIKIMKEGFNA